MTTANPTPEHELEEAAQGQDLYRAPGSELNFDDARDQAEGSGWLPPDVVHDWPPPSTHGDIVRRRQDLHDAMVRLEASLARSSRLADWQAQVGVALDRLQDALDRHVAEIEAPEGLFVEVIDHAPHLGPAIEALGRDHKDLLDACGQVRSMVATANTPPEKLRLDVLTLLGRLAVHRQTGTELLFDAYNIDIAAGD